MNKLFMMIKKKLNYKSKKELKSEIALQNYTIGDLSGKHNTLFWEVGKLKGQIESAELLGGSIRIDRMELDKDTTRIERQIQKDLTTGLARLILEKGWCQMESWDDFETHTRMYRATIKVVKSL